MIDLRSDTVTRPTSEMRRVIADADVGDDQFGEDPSVNRLQEEVGSLLGKEAALFVPTGTMANQMALRLFCRPGDDVIVGAESHMDGARLFNAAVATGELPRDLAAPFDLVWIGLSKGLGGPGGSVMAGRTADIATWCVIDACSAARCARRGCSPRRGVMRSLITSSGWSTTTVTRRRSLSDWQR